MTQSKRMRIEVEDIGDATIVNFVDKKILDARIIELIGKQLFALVDEQGRRRVVLNFQNVEYLSSAAMGKFISLQKKLGWVQGELILTNIHPKIYQTFETMRLNRFFTILPTEHNALMALGGASAPSTNSPTSAPDDSKPGDGMKKYARRSQEKEILGL